MLTARSWEWRIGIEPLHRFETYFINRTDRRSRLPRTVAATRSEPRHLPHEHRGSDWSRPIRSAGDRLVDFHVPTTPGCPRQGAVDWES